MSESRRTITPGIEITRDPEVQLERGAEQLAGLAVAISDWERASELHLLPVVSHDRTSIEFRLRMSSPPPLERWSLLIGEALHSLRSAMDGLAFQLTHLDGKSPDSPTKVYFPVANTSSQWRDKAKHLNSMPPEVLERIRTLQPFMADPAETSLLSAIHELDLIPKHRRLLRATTRVMPTDLGIELQFSSTRVEGTLVPLDRPPLEDGALALHLLFAVPPVSVRTRPVRNVPFLLTADTNAHQSINIGSIIAHAPSILRTQFDFVYTGEWPSEPSASPE